MAADPSKPVSAPQADARFTLTLPSEREILMTRVFDAPRELVFEAHIRPEHLAHWWGPRGFTLESCELDPRPGGAWRFVQRGPDGTTFAFRGEFREVVPPERITWTFEFEGLPGHVSVQTLSFTERSGRTTLTSLLRFESPEDRDGMLQSGMEHGTAEAWARLAERLQALPESPREIVATRLFDAPRELVFSMWCDPAHIARWWGPRGFSTTTQAMDVRPGGQWRSVMHGPDGRDYPNLIVYVEVERPERLVYDHVSGPPFHVTVTFDDAGGGTRLTMRMLFESAELRARVVREFGAVEGLQQTLARLAEHLSAGRS